MVRSALYGAGSPAGRTSSSHATCGVRCTFTYVSLAADPFPKVRRAEGYPIDVRIAPPREQSRLNVFFRYLLAIPAIVISGVMNHLIEILAFFAWFVRLALGHIPEGMRNPLAFTIRYHAQTQAYYTLVTPQYPSFNVGL